MTERLSAPAARGGRGLDVRPPPTAEMLARGRAVRRRRGCAVRRCRRRGGRGGRRSGWPSTGGDGSAATTRTDRTRGRRGVRAPRGAFSVGHGLPRRRSRSTIDDAIKSLYYTSAGVVVRSGSTADTNDGIRRYTLVAPTGRGRWCTPTAADRIPGFEPDAPLRLRRPVRAASSRSSCTTSSPTGAGPGHRADHPVESGWDAPAGLDRRRHGLGAHRPGLDRRSTGAPARSGRSRHRDTFELQNGRVRRAARNVGRSLDGRPVHSSARSRMLRAGTPSSPPTAASCAASPTTEVRGRPARQLRPRGRGRDPVQSRRRRLRHRLDA